MNSKKFWLKTEMVPVVAGFMLNSLRGDLEDFSSYSSVFSEEFINGVDAQKALCNELIQSRSLAGQLKLITGQLNDKTQELRRKLNFIEGYLILTDKELDMNVSDMGVKALRKQINRNNIAGIIMDVSTLSANLTRNINVLQTKGMSPQVTTELTTLATEINRLNDAQRLKESERSRIADANIKEFQKLWDMMLIISKAAKAIYRGVNAVKLKDYTISTLAGKVTANAHKEQPAPTGATASAS
ncbi:MAG: hypothetical protein ACP5F6_09550 [Microbacter sp.]